MIILDELRYLRDIFIKHARRLLHLLSTKVQYARTNIAKTLRQYCTLLFASAPARVHKALLELNLWLAEVLETSQCESIEQRHNRFSWLPLEEQHVQDRLLDGAFAADNMSTPELLKMACEFYMTRCDSLQHTNSDLGARVEQLKEEVKEALVRAFEMQQTLEQKRDGSTIQSRKCVVGVEKGDQVLQSSLHNQILLNSYQQIPDASLRLNVVSTLLQSRTIPPASDVAAVSDVGSIEVVDEEDGGTLEEDGISNFFHSDESGVDSILKREDGDCQKLVALQLSNERIGRWSHQALPSLKAQREHCRLLRNGRTQPAKKPLEHFSSIRVVCMEDPSYDAQEFLKLVSFREVVEDCEDLTWYRRALQHLKNERMHRASFRDRDSLASTISIVD